MTDFLTYAQLAKLTQIKLGTLYTLVSQYRIPHVRIARRIVRFRRDEIEAWLEQRHVPVADQRSEVIQ